MKCDYWEVLEIKDDEGVFHVVLGETRGGYLDSDYWKRSSPIKNFSLEDDNFNFTTASGNVYSGHADRKGLFVLII